MMRSLFLSCLCALPLAAQQLPLPDGSTGLDSKAGQQLLLESQQKADYWPLANGYETQANNSFCGPASSVMVLKALALPAPASTANPPFHEFQQSNFFTPEAEKVLPQAILLQQGATLEELAGMLRAHGARVEAHHAQDGGVDEFRRLAGAAVGDELRYVIINFDRTPLGQKGGTHFSPLAAYHAASDRFLVMDVARYRYPPFWVKTDDLFRALNTVDRTAGATRGYLLIGKP